MLRSMCAAAAEARFGICFVEALDGGSCGSIRLVARQSRRRLYVALRGVPNRPTTSTLEALQGMYAAVASVAPRLEAVPLYEGWEASPPAETIEYAVARRLPALASFEHAVYEAPTGDCEAPQTRDEPFVEHDDVAVGGTFDRLHAGHRLLLAASALTCSKRLYIGVTGDALLAKKNLANLLEPFEERARAAVDFVRLLKPDLEVFVSALVDPRAPPKAATLEAISALVVSQETLPGARKVAEMRREAGIMSPLEFVIVGLVFGEAVDEKLSSSQLRRRDAAEQGAARR